MEQWMNYWWRPPGGSKWIIGGDPQEAVDELLVETHQEEVSELLVETPHEEVDELLVETPHKEVDEL